MQVDIRMQIDIVDYARLVTQKAAVETMIGLDAGVFAVKTVAVEGLVLGAVEVDEDDMHTEMALIEQDTTVPLQVAVVGSEI